MHFYESDSLRCCVKSLLSQSQAMVCVGSARFQRAVSGILPGTVGRTSKSDAFNTLVVPGRMPATARWKRALPTLPVARFCPYLLRCRLFTQALNSKRMFQIFHRLKNKMLWCRRRNSLAQARSILCGAQ